MSTEKHTLRVELDAKEGAILRLFGLIQRRGFSIEGIEMPETEKPHKSVSLTVAPMGPAYRIEVLQRQIERLQEVRDVVLITQKTAKLHRYFWRKKQTNLQAQTSLS